jgi:hypothetical protein
MKIAVAFWTDNPEIPIRFGIALNLPQPSILDKSKDGAPVPATVAKGGNT